MAVNGKMNVLSDIVAIIQDNNSGSLGIETTAGTLLKDDLGIDSLRLVQIMVAIEQKYGIEFDVEDLDPRLFERVSDLVAVTEKTIGRAMMQ